MPVEPFCKRFVADDSDTVTRRGRSCKRYIRKRGNVIRRHRSVCAVNSGRAYPYNRFSVFFKIFVDRRLLFLGNVGGENQIHVVISVEAVFHVGKIQHIVRRSDVPEAFFLFVQCVVQEMIRSVERVRQRSCKIVADDERDTGIALHGLLHRSVPFLFRRFNHRIDFGIVEPAAVHIVPPESRALDHHIREISLQRLDRIFQRVRFTPLRQHCGICRFAVEIHGTAVAFDDRKFSRRNHRIHHHHIRSAHAEKPFVVADRRAKEIDIRRSEHP